MTFLAALYMMEIASCVILKLSAESPQLQALLHTLLHLSCVIHTVCTSLAGRSFSFIFCHSLVNKTHRSTALNWNSTCREKNQLITCCHLQRDCRDRLGFFLLIKL